MYLNIGHSYYIHLNPVRVGALKAAETEEGTLAMAAWFARHRAGMTLEQVRERLGAKSYSAVAMQIGRLQRKLPQNPQLRSQLRAIAGRLNVQC
jgi:hypothetical protein